ncbi:MAG: aminotransferase class V-fold PLP-dependent enzyme [Bacteroidetes bacterium]|nr:aminotransferase class V-fold PLP-dependent enzyme [Bacteroidota bacterium]
MHSPVYLDHNATTPVDARVLDAMLPFFTKNFGNASSRTHAYGWVAADAVEEARKKVAELISAEAQEIIFTSGATESINLAIKGVFENYSAKGKHIITTKTEHTTVLDCCAKLKNSGAEITYLGVDHEGKINPGELKNALRKDTILVCVMLANNETGTIQPIGEIAELVHANGSLLCSDTTQAIGKMRVDVNEMEIDLACISAHKIYGPKGSGALFIRRKDPRVTITAQVHGGGHERALRSGTLNVPGIVGLGKAAEIANEEWWNDAQRISLLRTKLEQQIQDCGNVVINGCIKDRLANTSNISILGIKADQLIPMIPNIAIATGSACTSAIPEPSHVLRAMGIDEETAFSSIRISLGKTTSEEEISFAGKEICNQIKELRY